MKKDYDISQAFTADLNVLVKYIVMEIILVNLLYNSKNQEQLPFLQSVISN